MDILLRIKRLVAAGRIAFTQKAEDEMERDGLLPQDVVESILNASLLRAKRSTSPRRKGRREMVYVIESFTYGGVLVYTKGILRRDPPGDETFYILISAKRSSRMEGP